MRNIAIQGRMIDIPDTWNELSFQQLHFVVKNYIMNLHHFFQDCGSGKIEPVSNDITNQINILLLWNLTGLPWKVFCEVPVEQIDYLLGTEKCVHFIHEDRGLTKVPFKAFGKLKGPADSFAGVTGHEFFFAMERYEEFINEKNKESLDAMIATFYRPSINLVRAPFELGKMGEYAEHKSIRKMPEEYKIMVMLWYEGCRAELVENNPTAHQGKKNSEGDYVELMLQLANDGPFGEYNKVRQIEVHLLFKELERVAKAAIEMEEKMKKH